MPDPRHLRHAPITEAIFDFRVKPRPGFNPELFEALAPSLKDRFPEFDRRKAGQVTFELSPTGPRPAEVKDLGMRGVFFRSSDGKLIAQFRVDGFTLNRLAPYTSWEDLFPIASDLWRRYSDTATPELVTRLAVRYINHIDLPEDLVRFDQFLRAAPPIPPELPQEMSAFLTRTTIHHGQASCAAHVTQLLQRRAPLSGLGLVLDIDAYSEVSTSPSDGLIIERFGGLRDYKNKIFFSYLTDRLLEKYE